MAVFLSTKHRVLRSQHGRLATIEGRREEQPITTLSTLLRGGGGRGQGVGGGGGAQGGEGGKGSPDKKKRHVKSHKKYHR